ncbi:hypothetical protein EDC39_11430 [Geothermobacter ehrlichii]|uniref:Uncharacterized protein n=1 Tax=Geothermobacter ehrlichii TaxID=213224 RepID=A0A5D3WHX5_9BACT|nr:hypothetical protein [Geothermobacter ehrlichii]TYO96325.1 hypothetical protein EDC39_11430 [Geothermobacter ehrlichii]
MNREEWLAQINENPNTNLLFLSVENTMLLFFDPPFPDVRGMSHCKEALKLIEKPFFLIAYSSRFDRKEKVEFFNKVSRERLESELEHNFDFLVPDSWIGIQKSSKDDISKDLIKFWDDCLYPQKVKRLAAFIDGRIKKDAGWGYEPIDSTIMLIQTPGRIVEYVDIVSYEERGHGYKCFHAVEAKNIEELKNFLRKKNVKYVDLKSMNQWDVESIFARGLEVDELTEKDYRWLTRVSEYSNRYISF